MIPVLTDDWWATSERLAEVAEGATGVELSATGVPRPGGDDRRTARSADVLAGGDRPANALGYLRCRRARMVRHAPWLYALPPHAYAGC